MRASSAVTDCHGLPVANSPAAVAAGAFSMRGGPVERDPWPASWFEVNDPEDAHRCQNMWAEALRLLLIDVCTEVAAVFARQAEWDVLRPKDRPRPQVRPMWVTSRDFRMVCALAGLDGQAVADRVIAKLATPEGVAEMIERLSGPTLRREPGMGNGHE